MNASRRGLVLATRVRFRTGLVVVYFAKTAKPVTYNCSILGPVIIGSLSSTSVVPDILQVVRVVSPRQHIDSYKCNIVKIS